MKSHAVRLSRRATVALLTFVFTFALPAAVAMAAADDEEGPAHDARLDNYPQNVVAEGGGVALTWFLVILLAALCVGVMFKNANRSHLD